MVSLGLRRIGAIIPQHNRWNRLTLHANDPACIGPKQGANKCTILSCQRRSVVGRILGRDELGMDATAGEPSLLDLRVTAGVDLTMEDGRPVARPRVARWYTLDELLRDAAEPAGGAEGHEHGADQVSAGLAGR